MPKDESFAPHAQPQRQILDDPDEVFDLVDLDDRVIGQARRGQVHRNPALIHRSVQILVFARDARVLLQRRSAAKDLYPDHYCASASGHVGTGEDYGETAERELVEELGISAPLTYLRKVLIRSEPETEMTALYVTQSDGPYHFHPTETAGGALFTLSEVLSGMASETLPVTPALRVAVDELMQRLEHEEGNLPAFLARLG